MIRKAGLILLAIAGLGTMWFASGAAGKLGTNRREFGLIDAGGNRLPPRSFCAVGRKVVVAITNGQLDFGSWEQIFDGEFDGRSAKRVLVKVIGE